MRRGVLRFIFIVGSVVLIIYLLSVLFSPSGNNEISYSEFQNQIKSGSVKRVNVAAERTTIVFLDSNRDNAVVIVNRIIIRDRLDWFASEYDWYGDTYNVAETNFANLEIYFIDPTQNSWFWNIFPLLLAVLFFIIIFVIIRNMHAGGGRAMSFGRTKARQVDTTKVRFTDVAGADEEKEELKEIVDFLKVPQRFLNVGARIPKGVLLVGPPGTGKTLLAKAVAGEASVPFFTISGSDFVEMFVGVGASRVRDLFEQAKKNVPCIIFIDEIDAVGRQRGTGMGGGHDEREQTLNQLLVQMDGFETNEGIIVLAATNRSDVLDPALLRPGRFDRQVYVHKPDVKGREAIIKVHARNKPLDPTVDFRQLARLTAGFAGADIENLLNEAAIFAARSERATITMEDITDAVGKVLMGPKKKSRVITEQDKRVTAFHEAGHAIVGMSVEYGDPVHEISIIPRGMAAGYAMFRPEGDDMHMSKNKLNDMLAMTLGGRVAEEIVIKDVTTGAVSDIQRATQIAKSMVTEWGMSDIIGPMSLNSGQEVFLGRDFVSGNGMSEHLSGIVDKEVKAILLAAHKRATEILTKKRKIMDNMARVLVEKETIFQEEIQLLMDGKTHTEVIEFIEQREREYRIRDEERRREDEHRRMLEQQRLQQMGGQMPWEFGGGQGGGFPPPPNNNINNSGNNHQGQFPPYNNTNQGQFPPYNNNQGNQNYGNQPHNNQYPPHFNPNAQNWFNEQQQNNNFGQQQADQQSQQVGQQNNVGEQAQHQVQQQPDQSVQQVDQQVQQTDQNASQQADHQSVNQNTEQESQPKQKKKTTTKKDGSATKGAKDATNKTKVTVKIKKSDEKKSDKNEDDKGETNQ